MLRCDHDVDGEQETTLSFGVAYKELEDNMML